jgi:hypothetical protein
MPKQQNYYLCNICNFTSSKKSNLDTHFSTHKHQSKIKMNILNTENAEIFDYSCKNCTKKYKARNSLWYHEQKCIKNNNVNKIDLIISENINSGFEKIEDSSANEIKVLTNLVLELVKSNADLQKQVLDVCQKIQPSSITNNNSTTHNNNKTFNLQFFLNEQCKDAMNVSEFVNSFQLKLEDLERVGRQGYVDGISHIIVSKLKETDIYKRPFHCSDAKRETLYVKDENGWEREGAENSKMIKAVKDVGQKNFTILNNYRLSNPECILAESADNDKYVQMMIQAAGSQKDNVSKVIKKIAKEVVIGK